MSTAVEIKEEELFLKIITRKSHWEAELRFEEDEGINATVAQGRIMCSLKNSKKASLGGD